MIDLHILTQLTATVVIACLTLYFSVHSTYLPNCSKNLRLSEDLLNFENSTATTRLFLSNHPPVSPSLYVACCPKHSHFNGISTKQLHRPELASLCRTDFACVGNSLKKSQALQNRRELRAGPDYREGATCSLFRTRNFFTAAKLAGQLFAKFGGSQKVAILRGFCKHQNRRPFILLK